MTRTCNGDATCPIFFLDVDGVVNAAGPEQPDHLSFTTASTAGVEWPIRYSSEIVIAINAIAENGLAEIRWLTTWGQDARTSLAPSVGLRDFTAYDMSDSAGWWKAEIVAKSILDEKRPVVWVDDELLDSAVEELKVPPGLPALLIAPEESCGLVASEMQSITEFLREVPCPL